MSVGFVRPNVSELQLHVFERSVHPELFEIFAAGIVQQPKFLARFQICDEGHTVEFRTPSGILTEVVAAKGHTLPERFEVFQRRVKGSRDESLRCQNGLAYSTSFQSERLSPEAFLALHDELLQDCEKAPLSYIFPPANRLAPAALSYLQVDVWPNSILVHTCHTFPADCAIVKTQSLFEV